MKTNKNKTDLNNENGALIQSCVSVSVFYNNDLLKNIANNAEHIYKSKRIKGIKFNDEWFETIVNLCEQSKDKSEFLQMQKDIEVYKNRIIVLSNLNKKYREKLGMSNEPMDLDLLTPLQ